MYGFLIGITSVISILFAEKIIQRKKLNIAESEFYNLILIIFVLSIIGGRLYHILDAWDYYSNTPLSIFYLWNGGFGIFGSIIIVCLYLILYSKLKKRPIFLFTDLLCFFTPFIQIAGRIGNYFNNELLGARFEILLLGIFVFVEVINFKKIKFGKGLITAYFLISYGVIRLLLEPFRNTNNSFLINNFNLTYFFCVFLLLAGFGIIFKRKI